MTAVGKPKTLQEILDHADVATAVTETRSAGYETSGTEDRELREGAPPGCAGNRCSGECCDDDR